MKKMTVDEIKKIVEEVLVSVAAEKAAERIMEKMKHALVVYTGSMLGFAENLDQLAELKQNGFSFSLYMTDSAEALLDKDRIVKTLEPDEIIEGRGTEPPETVAAGFENFIVPAMTVNTASKIASCMADNWPSRLIVNALMRGRKVVISVDGCCPDNPQRAKLGYYMNDALKAKLRDNKNKMGSYGAVLTTGNSLCRDALQYFAGQHAEQNSSEPASCIAPFESNAASGGGKTVIGSDSVIRYAEYGNLVVPRNAIVTALARETAAKYGVRIVRE